MTRSLRAPLFRPEESLLDPAEKLDEQHRDDDHCRDGRIHLRVFGDGLVVGDDVADAGRRDEQLGQDRADEPGRRAEAQAREDDRASPMAG